MVRYQVPHVPSTVKIMFLLHIIRISDFPSAFLTVRPTGQKVLSNRKPPYCNGLGLHHAWNTRVGYRQLVQLPPVVAAIPVESRGRKTPLSWGFLSCGPIKWSLSSSVSMFMEIVRLQTKRTVSMDDHFVCQIVKVQLLRNSTSLNINFICENASVLMASRDSLDRVATWYGMDGPRFESRWGRDFTLVLRPALGSKQLPIQRVTRNSRGRSGRSLSLNV